MRILYLSAGLHFRAYNPGTNHLYLTNYVGVVATITVLDASTGSFVGTLNNSGIARSAAQGFIINQIDVADDGAIYVGNTVTGSNAPDGAKFRIYRYANESSAPVLVYDGNAGVQGLRVADSFDVRGSGQVHLRL